MQRLDDPTSGNKIEIHYWPGTIPNIESFIKKHKEKIQQLMNRDYAGLNYEALQGSDIYSIRLNVRDRLLFADIPVAGKKQLTMLEVVLFHDLQKARFLRDKRVLRNFLKIRGQHLLDKKITSEDFVEVKPAEISEMGSVVAGEDFTLIPIILSGSKFIKLNEGSETLPLVVTGSAGSGKSSFAIALLQKKVLALRPLLFSVKRNANILYVTESESLIEMMRRNWLALPTAASDEESDYQVEVEFKSYAELLKTLEPELAQCQAVGKAKFIEFINQQLKHLRNELKSAKKKTTWCDNLFAEQDAIYQEFRIISGCPDKAFYLDRGSLQSLFKKDSPEREWLFAQYPLYVSYLKKMKCYDPAFIQAEIKASYAMVVVDESQDFSHLQLELLRKMALDDNICFCRDDRQSLVDSLSKDSYINYILGAQNRRLSYLNLTSSYRCPEKVMGMANAISEVKALALGEKLPDKVVSSDNSKSGNVIWYKNITSKEELDFKEMAKSTDFAIITDADNVQRLSARFETNQVFSYESCKGLEFGCVLVYEPIKGEVFKQVNKDIVIPQREKAEEAKLHIVPAFNAVYTAFTRSTDTLIIVQAGDQRACHIIEYLQKALPKQSSSCAKQENLSERELLQRVDEFLGNKRMDIAKRLFVDTIGGSESAFNEYCERFFAAGRSEVPAVVEVAAPVPIATVRASSGKSMKKKKTANKSVVVVSAKTKVVVDYVMLATNCYQSLLKSSAPTEFKQLCSRPDAHLILFVPLPSYQNECLFTLLCDESRFRAPLLSVMLPKYARQWGAYLTADVLCRKNGMHGSAVGKMPPLFWISKNEHCVAAIHRDEAMFVAVVAAIKLRPSGLVVPALTPGADNLTCAFYWFSSFPIGIDFIFRLCMKFHEMGRQLSSSLLTTKHQRSLGHLGNSVFNHLILNSVGVNALTVLLTQNPSLAEYVSCSDFFPFVPGPQKNYSVFGSPAGKSLIHSLDAANPKLCASKFLSMNIEELKQQDDRYNSIEVRYSDELRVIKALLDNATLETMWAFFSRPDAGVYLFHIPVRNYECLFTVLFNRADTREILLEHILVSFANRLGKEMTTAALCGVNESGVEIAPLLWMSGSEELINIVIKWMEVRRDMTISLEALMHEISVPDYLKSKLPVKVSAFNNPLFRPIISHTGRISALTLLMLSEAGRSLLLTLLQRDQVNIPATINMMFGESIKAVALNKNICMVKALIQTTDGARLLNSMTQHGQWLRSDVVNKFLCEDLAIDEDLLDSNCSLMQLHGSKARLALLGVLILPCAKQLDKQIVKTLMHAFTKDALDTGYSVKRMAILFTENSCVLALNEMLCACPDIIDTFDADLFTPSSLKNCGAEKRALIACAERSTAGQALLNNIRALLKIKRAKSEMNVSAPFVFFHPEEGRQDGVGKKISAGPKL